MLNTHHTHIIKVGNSKGIRIPKEWLVNFETDKVVLEPVKNGIIVRSATSHPQPRTRWAAILSKMNTKQSDKDLSDWDNTLADGID